MSGSESSNSIEYKLVSETLINYVSVFCSKKFLKAHSNVRTIMDFAKCSKLPMKHDIFHVTLEEIIGNIEDPNKVDKCIRDYHDDITKSLYKNPDWNEFTELVFQHFTLMFWYKYAILMRNVKKIELPEIKPYEVFPLVMERIILSTTRYPPCILYFIQCCKKEVIVESKEPVCVHALYTESQLYKDIRESYPPIELEEAIKIGWVCKRNMETVKKMGLDNGHDFDLVEYFYFLFDFYDLEQDWIKEYNLPDVENQ